MNTLDDETPEQARALDAWLATDRVPPPSAALREAIVRDFRSRTGGFWRGLWHELGGLRLVGPALTASLALGIAGAAMTGAFLPAAAPDDTDVDADDYIALALLESGDDEDYLP